MAPDIDYSALPRQRAYSVDIDACPLFGDPSGGEDWSQQFKVPMQTSDLTVAWSTGEPGDVVDWHTHMPTVYEILVPLRGRAIWHFRDNDGAEKRIEAGQGEMVYLPAGAENKMEVVGDEPLELLSIFPNESITRVGQLLGGVDRVDPEGRSIGLWFDDRRDEVVSKRDEAVTSS